MGLAILFLITLFIVFSLNFLINAGLLWVFCWALNAIGITSIAGFSVAFSWPLTLIITIISLFLRNTFSIDIKK